MKADRISVRWRHGLSLAIFLLLCLTLFSPLMPDWARPVMDGQSAVIVVDAGGSGDHTSIQTAIDAAAHGDRIEVMAGTYQGNLRVDTTVTLAGEGMHNTIIEGSGVEDAVNITADGVEMSGFMVINSGSVGKPNWDSGVEVFEASDVVLSSLNASYNFCGIALTEAYNCTITGNICQFNEVSGIHPYRSERINISDNECSYNVLRGMMVEESSQCVVLDNVCGNNVESQGIFLMYTDLSTVSRNVCRNNINGSGLYLHESHHNTVSGNELTRNFYNGLLLGDSDWNLIEGNHIHNNTRSGICGIDTRFGTYENNLCELNLHDGIIMDDSSSEEFGRNRCNSNGWNGLKLRVSTGALVHNNTCRLSGTYNGISLSHSVYAAAADNTCEVNNGAGIYVYNHSSSSEIRSNTARFNKGNGISMNESQRMTITGNTCYDNRFNGVSVHSGSHRATVQANTCNSNEIGILLMEDVNGTVVRNNQCDDNMEGVILWDRCDGNVVTRNRCVSNFNNGIGLFFNSNYNNVSKNVCTENLDGIFLAEVCDDNIMVDNVCELNRNDGMAITYNSSGNFVGENTCRGNINGLHLSFADENTISWNQLSDSRGRGLLLENGSSANTFTNNNISANLRTGISIDGGAGNTLYHNCIMDNELQAEDLGSSHWDDGSGHGNHWSDYTGLDNGAGGRVAGDGIGDTAVPHLGLDDYPYTDEWGWMITGIPWLTIPAGVDDDGRFDISWESLETPGGYALEESTTADFGSPAELYTGPERSYLREFAINGTYYYRVRSIDGGTPGLWSQVQSKTVDHSRTIEEDIATGGDIDLHRWFDALPVSGTTYWAEDAQHFNISVDLSGSVAIQPEEDWSGQELLVFHATKGLADVANGVLVTVNPVNDPPRPVTITSPGDETIVNAGELVDLSAVCSDPDEPYGDALSYSWNSLYSGYIGEGQAISGVLLPIGIHEITVTVSDGEAPGVFDSIVLYVIASIESDTDRDGMPDLWEEEHGLDPLDPSDAYDDPDDDGRSNLDEFEDETDPNEPDDDTGTRSATALVITFIIIVVVIFLIAFYVLVTRKARQVAHDGGEPPWRPHSSRDHGPEYPGPDEEGPYIPPGRRAAHMDRAHTRTFRHDGEEVLWSDGDGRGEYEMDERSEGRRTREPYRDRRWAPVQPGYHGEYREQYGYPEERRPEDSRRTEYRGRRRTRRRPPGSGGGPDTRGYHAIEEF